MNFWLEKTLRMHIFTYRVQHKNQLFGFKGKLCSSKDSTVGVRKERTELKHQYALVPASIYVAVVVLHATTTQLHLVPRL